MNPPTPESEPVPAMQKLLDSPFVLLGLGMAVMFAVYTLWGLVEIMSLPQALLP